MKYDIKTTTQAKEYGYLWEGMDILTFDEALEIYKNEQRPVFLLHRNNTESLVESLVDIHEHKGALYGVEKSSY